jgi:hypothetical protein
MIRRQREFHISQAVLRALASALLPAVRVFQMGGFGVGEFEVAAKLAFVQVAAEKGRTKGGRTNVSRIAAMTGLTRKEVRQLLQILEQKGRLVAPSVSRQRTARVLDAWRTDPLYLDDRGRPRLLSVAGTEPSFQTLVKSYGGDVTPTSVLRELERTGAVRIQADGRVRCRSASSSSGAVDTPYLLEFARRMQEFGAAVSATAGGGDSRTFYGFREAAIAPADLARLFHATFAERASSLLTGADRWVASRQRQRPGAARKAESEPQPVTVRIGVFLSDAYPQPAAPAPLRPRRRTVRR